MGGILLIDDDEDDILFLKESLLQAGFRSSIYAVLSGQEAFRFLNEQQEMPSLIILDLNMPEMNGIKVLEKLQLEYNIPVIVYATSCTEEIIGEVKSRGAIDCLKKGTSYFDNLKFATHVVQLLRSF